MPAQHENFSYAHYSYIQMISLGISAAIGDIMNLISLNKWRHNGWVVTHRDWKVHHGMNSALLTVLATQALTTFLVVDVRRFFLYPGLSFWTRTIILNSIFNGSHIILFGSIHARALMHVMIPYEEESTITKKKHKQRRIRIPIENLTVKEQSRMSINA